MAEIKLNLKNSDITQKSILEYKEQVENIHKDLHRRANHENDFVGWLELPTNYDKKEFARIKKAAKKIKKESDTFKPVPEAFQAGARRDYEDKGTAEWVKLSGN